MCNWIYNVPPPCGTKPPVVTAPPSKPTSVSTTKSSTTIASTAQAPILGNCTSGNFCEQNGFVCCWHIPPNISGCCDPDQICCPSQNGDLHDCCPKSEQVCHANGGQSCTKGRVRENLPKIRGRNSYNEILN